MKPTRFVDGSTPTNAMGQYEHFRVGTIPVDTGFSHLDETWCPATGQFVILAGRPGSFKTTLSWQICLHAVSRGKRALWCNVEPSMASMYEMAMARMAKIPRRVLGPRGRVLSAEEGLRLTAASEEFCSMPIAFQFENTDVRAITKRAHDMKADLVFVDYLQLLNAPGAKTPPERIEAVSHELRDLAHHGAMYVFALVQMNRAIENDGQKERLPRLSDLAGSAALEADADIVAFMYDVERRGDLAHVAVYTAKNRFGPSERFDRMRINAAMCECFEVTASVQPLKVAPPPKPWQDLED